ncbi:hypothetical protein JOF42_000351 [Microbacterium phyllosphaerae]|uniref:DUF4381 domain-containing protein n=1 Tax=Microbacterium phyllosphaerae TaxID=124798 RepID=A0ABS4WLF0_9MICO|nr:hypothetical protein [Microbacterium phyllosphaerae]MBP2376856.1 hypothetical protein [Microbacterium phyllosphaerae]
MPTPIPSPTPEMTRIVVDSAATGSEAPWWGIPVVAGCFLIIGSVLSFLFTRRNEDRKSERDARYQANQLLLDAGAELLAAGDLVHALGLKALPRSTAEFMDVLAAESYTVQKGFQVASRRFSFIMPNSYESDFKNYARHTFLLLVPPFDGPRQSVTLDKQQEASVALVGRMRELRGLDPLERVTMPLSDAVSLAKQAEEQVRSDIARESDQHADRDSVE